MNTRNRQKPAQRNEGVALILTLLFVVLLTVLVVEFAYEAQVEASYSLNSGNDFQARLAARSAVYKGISILETDRLQAELAQDGQTSPADSRLSAWALPGEFEPLNDAVMRTTITDEFGKINLNALLDYSTGTKVVRAHLREALVQLFTIRGTSAGIDVEPDVLVSSVIDWLDEDDEVDESGAESDFYLGAENPYPCKNGPMDSLDELLLVRGMSADLYFGPRGLDPPMLPLSEFLTVHGDWLGRINPNTVYIDYESGESDVLEAYSLGCIDAGLVTELDFEQMVDDMLSVEDEFGAFQSLEDLRAGGYVVHIDLSEFAQTDGRRTNRNRGDNNNPNNPNTDTSQAEVEVMRQLFTVHSHAFRIHGDALLDEIMVRNEAYVFRVPQDPETLDWPNGSVTLPDHPIYSGLELPEEFYRILEWKVIQ